ncbi:MAG: clostripain-related cysteine peptidase [Chloroflexi bacterium]|nr:clostripain-related cysteine peptidase [Chloroflexota bacterium]
MLLLTLPGCGAGGGGGGGSVSSDPYVSGENIIRVDPGTDANALALEYLATVEEDFTIGGNRYLRLSFNGSVPTKNSDLQTDPQVYSAEPNYIYNSLLVPDDPDYAAFQYAPQLIGAEAAWDGTVKDGNKILAVIDTGIDLTHPEFTGRGVAGYDFVNDRVYPAGANYDDNGHGTAVAGIACAEGNNGEGIAGLSWGGRLMPVKVLDSSGQGNMYNVCRGIIFAVDNGADVINVSMGSGYFSYALQDAVDYAAANGVVVIAGMGNDGSATVAYPAGCQGVIAVGSTDQNDGHSSFSNTGSHISMCAPGTDIYSTDTGQAYATGSGTSLSAAHVSGAALMMLALHPAMTPSQVRSQLESTAVDLGAPGFDTTFGSGRLDLQAALGAVQPFRCGDAEVTVTYDGSVVRGEHVIIKDAGQNTVANALTDDSGVARFFSLSAGNYTAEATYEDTTTSSPFSITGGNTTSLTVDVPFVGKKWTVMVYMDGDNNLEEYGIQDLNEMETQGSTDDVNFVVQFDRIPGNDSTNGNWTDTRRFYVTKDSNTSIINSQMVQDMGELDMSNPQTLVNFATWTMENYPARHYMLVLWNHGGGVKSAEQRAVFKDICWDDTTGYNAALTMVEMKTALSDIYTATGKKIDLLAFDACYMDMLEIGYQARNYANYMAASENTEPGEGYPYNLIASDLVSNPNMTPAQLGISIVDNYNDFYSAQSGICYSLTDLSKINAVRDAVNVLGQRLQTLSPSQNTIGQIAKNSQRYDYDFVDLRDFASGLIAEPEVTGDLRTAATGVWNLTAEGAGNFIYYERHNSGTPYGTAIFFPSLAWNSSYSTYSTKYSQLDFAADTQWNEFLQYHQTNY